MRYLNLIDTCQPVSIRFRYLIFIHDLPVTTEALNFKWFTGFHSCHNTRSKSVRHLCVDISVNRDLAALSLYYPEIPPPPVSNLYFFFYIMGYGSTLYVGMERESVCIPTF